MPTGEHPKLIQEYEKKVVLCVQLPLTRIRQDCKREHELITIPICRNVYAVVGAGCTENAASTADAAERYELPVVSNGAAASALTSATKYTYFLR